MDLKQQEASQFQQVGAAALLTEPLCSRLAVRILRPGWLKNAGSQTFAEVATQVCLHNAVVAHTVEMCVNLGLTLKRLSARSPESP